MIKHEQITKIKETFGHGFCFPVKHRDSIPLDCYIQKFFKKDFSS